jgi:DNA-binding MarR family transcriptional regulator
MNESVSLPMPKSRIVPLGYGSLPFSMKRHEFEFLVYDVKLTREMKRSLLYYSSRFNWDKRRATYVSLCRAANDLQIGRKYLSKALRELEALGWVEVSKNAKTRTYAVSPKIGQELANGKWPEALAKETQLMEQGDYK